MLRLHAEGNAEEFSCLYYQKYTESAYSLHSLGEELSAEVGHNVLSTLTRLEY